MPGSRGNVQAARVAALLNAKPPGGAAAIVPTTISIVQTGTTSGGGGDTEADVTLLANVSASSTIIVMTTQATDQEPQCSDSVFGNYTLVDSIYDAATGQGFGIHKAEAHAGGTAAILTRWSPAVTGRGVYIWELDGGTVQDFETNQQTNAGSGTDDITSGGALAQSAYEGLLLAMTLDGGINYTNVLSVGTGFTDSEGGLIIANYGQAEHKTAGLSGNAAATFTSSQSAIDSLTGAVLVQVVP